MKETGLVLEGNPDQVGHNSLVEVDHILRIRDQVQMALEEDRILGQIDLEEAVGSHNCRTLAEDSLEGDMATRHGSKVAPAEDPDFAEMGLVEMSSSIRCQYRA